MVIVYASMTGNVEHFVSVLDYPAIYHISDYTEDLGEFVLITYTAGMGEVPDEVTQFLSKHGRNIKGVVASGNVIWKNNYGKSADIISQKYRVPVLMKFQQRGTNKDRKNLLERMEEIELHRA